MVLVKSWGRKQKTTSAKVLMQEQTYFLRSGKVGPAVGASPRERIG